MAKAHKKPSSRLCKQNLFCQKRGARALEIYVLNGTGETVMVSKDGEDRVHFVNVDTLKSGSLAREVFDRQATGRLFDRREIEVEAIDRAHSACGLRL